jgi:hypothetical protein
MRGSMGEERIMPLDRNWAADWRKIRVRGSAASGWHGAGLKCQTSGMLGFDWGLSDLDGFLVYDPIELVHGVFIPLVMY